MKIFHHSNTLKSEIESLRSKGHCIGFVPTMGALHKGHLSLMKAANKDKCKVVVSIFVNPTQFDNPEDLKKYPRTLESDVELMKTLGFDILVYAPDASDLYGNSVSSMKFNFGKLERQMEGKFRDGHFDGVGTVLTLLFNAVNPDKAYFGEKDFQQLQIVRKLNQIQNFNIDIIGCPIVREENGLAMSSRNRRLSEREFAEAAFIYHTLGKVASEFGKKSIPNLTKWVKEQFLNNEYLRLEYFIIANEKSLEEAFRKRKGNQYRAFIAVHCGKVRLIDNMSLN